MAKYVAYHRPVGQGFGTPRGIESGSMVNKVMTAKNR